MTMRKLSVNKFPPGPTPCTFPLYTLYTAIIFAFFAAKAFCTIYMFYTARHLCALCVRMQRTYTNLLATGRRLRRNAAARERSQARSHSDRTTRAV